MNRSIFHPAVIYLATCQYQFDCIPEDVFTTEDQMHGLARGMVANARGLGGRLHKKKTRFNDIVAVGVFYSRIGGDGPLRAKYALGGMTEAVSTCLHEDPDYDDDFGPLSLIHDWMLPATENVRAWLT